MPLLSFGAIILIAAGIVSLASVAIGRCARPWDGRQDAGRRGKLVLVAARLASLAVALLGFVSMVAYGLHLLGLGDAPVLDEATKLVGVSFGLLLATLAAQAGYRKGLGR